MTSGASRWPRLDAGRVWVRSAAGGTIRDGFPDLVAGAATFDHSIADGGCVQSYLGNDGDRAGHWAAKRSRGTALLALLVALPAAMALTTKADAALRFPQVLVLGGALQASLDSLGEHIDIQADQDATQRWGSPSSMPGSCSNITIELIDKAAATTLSLYNASAPAPTLYEVFPAVATSGWWASVSFATAPARVAVNVFDVANNLAASTTYLGADRSDFGFYLHGPDGTHYTQDARNPGGDPQALTCGGTGVYQGEWWMCWEDLPLNGGGSDHDFDDCVLLVSALCDVPVLGTSWGRLKARHR